MQKLVPIPKRAICNSHSFSKVLLVGAGPSADELAHDVARSSRHGFARTAAFADQIIDTLLGLRQWQTLLTVNCGMRGPTSSAVVPRLGIALALARPRSIAATRRHLHALSERFLEAMRH